MEDSFYHDPWLAERSHELQWKSYLQDQYNDERISSSIETNSKAIVVASERQTLAIQEANQRQVDAMREATQHNTDVIVESAKHHTDAMLKSAQLVSSRLKSGFSKISKRLDNISDEISELSSLFDWRMSMIIEEQRINNILSENIALLLRIPDFQKERQYHLEQGLKFFKNARMDEDLYADALENLLEAEKREKTDYFVIHRIGLIYLYGKKYIDIPKAEEYFRRAAKYAIVESHPDAIRLTNLLAGNLLLRLSKQATPQEAIKAVAAESFFQAGVACYIPRKFSETAELASKAFSLDPKMLEAGFLQAKALAADGKVSLAVDVLERVITANRNYAVKTVRDLDLGSKPPIQALLEKLRDDAVNRASQRLEKCKLKMIPESQAKMMVELMEKLIKENTYLEALFALDEMAKIRNWEFGEPFKNPNQVNYLNKIIEIVNSLNNLQYYKVGNKFIQMNENIINEIIVNQEIQWIFPSGKKSSEANWKNAIKSKRVNYDLFTFIDLEKKFNDNLPKVVNNLENRLKDFSNDNIEHINYLKNERIKSENERIKAESERRIAEEKSRKLEEERLRKAENDRLKKAKNEKNKILIMSVFFGFLGAIGMYLIGVLFSNLVINNSGPQYSYEYKVNLMSNITKMFVIFGFIIGLGVGFSNSKK